MALGFGSDGGGGLTAPDRQGGYGASTGAPGYSAPKPTPNLAVMPGYNEWQQGIKDKQLNTDGTVATNGPHVNQQTQPGSSMQGAPLPGAIPPNQSSAPSGGDQFGYSKDTQGAMVGEAQDQISAAQGTAHEQADERAAALGFARSGGTEEAQQRIDTAANADKNAALRSVQTESGKLAAQQQDAAAGRAEQEKLVQMQIQAQKDAAEQQHQYEQDDTLAQLRDAAVKAQQSTIGGVQAPARGDQFPIKFSVVGGGSGRQAVNAGAGGGGAGGMGYARPPEMDLGQMLNGGG